MAQLLWLLKTHAASPDAVCSDWKKLLGEVPLTEEPQALHHGASHSHRPVSELPVTSTGDSQPPTPWSKHPLDNSLTVRQNKEGLDHRDELGNRNSFSRIFFQSNWANSSEPVMGMVTKNASYWLITGSHSCSARRFAKASTTCLKYILHVSLSWTMSPGLRDPNDLMSLKVMGHFSMSLASIMMKSRHYMQNFIMSLSLVPLASWRAFRVRKPTSIFLCAKCLVGSSNLIAANLEGVFALSKTTDFSTRLISECRKPASASPIKGITGWSVWKFSR